jgi:NAD(P)H dehydrogenase (quinone)
VQHLAVPAEALKAGMLSAGLPPMMAEILSAFDVSASKGLLDKSAGDLEALTGKGGRTLQELLEANRSAWAL